MTLKLDVVATPLIAIGLAMDAFAVSIANGISTRRLRMDSALKMAVSFGLFQAFMPALGWLAGLTLMEFISGLDHWVAFALLCVIGSKMISEAFTAKSDEKKHASLSIPSLLMLSVATSIDALAVGLSFALLKAPIATPIIVIGTVTFLLSFLGPCFGNRLGRFFEKGVGILGGLILVIIGIKILVEHIL